jgi:uncharacterized membrane protein YfcA
MVGLVLAIPIGALLVLLGAGGSIATVPVLMYGAGLDVHQAAGTSLLIVGLVAAAGAIAKRRAVDVRTGLLVGVGGVAGAWIGAWLNHQTADTVVLAAFALTLLFAAYRMAQPRSAHPRAEAHGRGLVLAYGVGLGIATGFFGVGGGFLIVPVLTLCLGMEASAAIATSLAVIACNSLGGLAGHAAHGAVHWQLGLMFTAAALGGGLAVLPFAASLRAQTVQQIFAGLLGVVGVGMLAQAVGTLIL